MSRAEKYSYLPAIFAIAVVLMAGIGTLTWATDGWRIWTAETARREAVLNHPKALPAVNLTDSHGRSVKLKHQSQLVVVDFIFTQCPTVCLAMGAQFRQLQDQLSAEELSGQVRLLSLSFDPENDHQAQLTQYLSRFGAVDPYWKAARFDQIEQLQDTLDQLGVIVIPEPTLGFVHNAAFYLIEDGYVVGIYDVEELERLSDDIRLRANALNS